MESALFIFSLPRSGSTLLQRVIASHNEVVTTTEPWVLLPFFYSLKPDGIFAEYSHLGLVKGLHDFMAELPNKEQDYLDAVRMLAHELYGKTAGASEAKYFLDKTPRYSLICEELIRTFPDGKFIFLWRNPLSVIASTIETWGKGRWNIYRLKVDFYKGLPNLVDAYIKHPDKVLSVNYDAFVSDPMPDIKRISAYLGLQFNDDVLETFSSVSLSGKMGDATGICEYTAVSDEPLHKWKVTICNPWRKWWCKRYLKWLGKERLDVMGYDLHQLLSELDALPFNHRYFLSDLAAVFYGSFYSALSLTTLNSKWEKLHNYLVK